MRIRASPGDAGQYVCCRCECRPSLDTHTHHSASTSLITLTATQNRGTQAWWPFVRNEQSRPHCRQAGKPDLLLRRIEVVEIQDVVRLAVVEHDAPRQDG